MPSLTLGLIMLLSAQLTYDQGIDFEKEYARPTITSIGPFDAMPGRKPDLHVHIQYRRVLYICSAKSDVALKTNGLTVGAKIEILEQGKYLRIRGPGQRKWAKLKLVHKAELSNL